VQSFDYFLLPCSCAIEVSRVENLTSDEEIILYAIFVVGRGWRPNSFVLNWGLVLYSASEEVRLEGGHGSWRI